MREKRGTAESAEAMDRSRHLLGMQSLFANRLYDAEGNFVGRLEEVILDVRSGCVQHVVVAVGGIDGIGRRRLAVPWSALIPDADYRRCVIDVAQMRLTAVQVSDADPWLRRARAPRAGDGRFSAETARSERETEWRFRATGSREHRRLRGNQQGTTAAGEVSADHGGERRISCEFLLH